MMVYVFDYREKTGYSFRAPRLVARLVCHFRKWYDYAPNPDV